MKNSKPSSILLTAALGGLHALIETKDFLLQKDQGSFEDYINKYAKQLDQFIIDYERENSARYGGGEVHLVLEQEEKLYLQAEFYFKNQKEEWEKKTIKGNSVPINWALTKQFQESLKQIKKVSFDYERPE